MKKNPLAPRTRTKLSVSTPSSLYARNPEFFRWFLFAALLNFKYHQTLQVIEKPLLLHILFCNRSMLTCLGFGLCFCLSGRCCCNPAMTTAFVVGISFYWIQNLKRLVFETLCSCASSEDEHITALYHMFLWTFLTFCTYNLLATFLFYTICLKVLLLFLWYIFWHVPDVITSIIQSSWPIFLVYCVDLMASQARSKINYLKATIWKYIIKFFIQHCAPVFLVLLVSILVYFFYYSFVGVSALDFYIIIHGCCSIDCLCYIDCLLINWAFCLAGLVLQGHLLAAVDFIYRHHDCLYNIVLLSTVRSLSFPAICKITVHKAKLGTFI